MSIAERITQLKNEWIDESTLADMYGLALTESGLQRDFIRWGRLLRRPRDVIRGNTVSRFALETFFQHRKVLPLKLAAARLGMTRSSLEHAILAIETSGRVDVVRVASENLVPEDIDRTFIQVLPSLQGRTFSDHDAFCRRLHEAVSSELKEYLLAPLEPLHCVTARARDEDDYAYSFCVLTDKPTGLRYRVWLDFGKPLNLTPDTCSFLAYFNDAALLQSHLMQQAPESPVVAP